MGEPEPLAQLLLVGGAALAAHRYGYLDVLKGGPRPGFFTSDGYFYEVPSYTRYESVGGALNATYNEARNASLAYIRAHPRLGGAGSFREHLDSLPNQHISKPIASFANLLDAGRSLVRYSVPSAPPHKKAKYKPVPGDVQPGTVVYAKHPPGSGLRVRPGGHAGTYTGSSAGAAGTIAAPTLDPALPGDMAAPASRYAAGTSVPNVTRLVGNVSAVHGQLVSSEHSSMHKYEDDEHEISYFDAFVTNAVGARSFTTVDDSNVLLCNLVPSGAAANQRRGRSITMHRLFVRGVLATTQTNPTLHRVMVVYDSACRGAATLGSDLIDEPGTGINIVGAFRNMDHQRRLTVLYDQTITTPAGSAAGNVTMFDFEVDLHNLPAIFSPDSSPPSVADIQSGSVTMHLFSFHGLSNTVNVQTRLLYDP